MTEYRINGYHIDHPTGSERARAEARGEEAESVISLGIGVGKSDRLVMVALTEDELVQHIADASRILAIKRGLRVQW